AWSPTSESRSRGCKLNSYSCDMEAASFWEAARPDPGIPGHILPSGERRATQPAIHNGCRSARST
ncbi:hypothetical protein M9458_003516, partial [Cirrhinus mrigala]